MKISTEEKWIGYYFEELMKKGYIDKIIFQPNHFILSNGLKKKMYKFKQLKTKINKVYSNKTFLINPHIYTPDYRIVWNIDKSYNLFTEKVLNPEIKLDIPFYINNINNKHISIIEVKAEFDRNNMTRMFTTHIQPIMWDKHEIYVQLTKPVDLFKKTFIPKKVLPDFLYKKAYKNKKIGDHKYNWEYKTLEQWIKTIKSTNKIGLPKNI